MPQNAPVRSSMSFPRHTVLGTACAAALLLGGCAGANKDLTAELFSSPETPAQTDIAATPQSELEKATDYWGKKFAKSPTTLEYALNYSRNLKAMGRNRQALAALQHASEYNGQNRELAGEYGRLALEMGQVETAKKVLSYADDPTKPDWRIVSARGTVFAKEKRYKEAIEMFERAMALSNSKPSVMNNLAMAYALDGRASDGERLLREAAAKENSPKVQKNLALVLGLQGKYDEAKAVGNQVLPASTVASDTTLVQQMVRLDPKPFQANAVRGSTAIASTPALRQTAQPDTSNNSWDAKVASAGAAR